MKRLFFFVLISLLSLQVIQGYSQEQRIEVGNVIKITVLGYPELSLSVVVRQDGTVEYPLLLNIPIYGMTQSELSELLYPILARHVERPQLFIYIEEYLMIQIRIQGQVNSPGLHTLVGPIGLQRALSAAGGPTKEADIRHISIIRKENNIDREIPVDLYKFFNNELPWLLMPEIKNGDIIIVPMLGISSYIRVMGAVRSPGNYLPKPGRNIADVINQAGGNTLNGNLNKVIYISRNEDGYSTQLLIGANYSLHNFSFNCRSDSQNPTIYLLK